MSGAILSRIMGSPATSVEIKLHVHDLHATILYLLGLDHTRLTCIIHKACFAGNNVAFRSAKGWMFLDEESFAERKATIVSGVVRHGVSEITTPQARRS